MRVLILLASLLLFAGIDTAQVVDRMVAVVNKHVIMESQLDEATRVEFLLQSKPLEQRTYDDNAAALDRLIDQSLIDQQMMQPDMLDPLPSELAVEMKQVRDSVPQGNNDEHWKSVLASYGLTQQDVENYLIARLRILKFVELRFRGLVRVEKDAVAAYYENQFLPELRKRNVNDPPRLAEVSAKIEQILVEQRIDDLQKDWLKTLRTQAHIEKMLTAASTTGSGATP
ncbi:MAG TPA: SurA N-terminal domain-containing protein [Candidatus Angelobacter sp.]|nr:SurA N-terminal domain-containing protein [Candidatus Angelobacter sp.]